MSKDGTVKRKWIGGRERTFCLMCSSYTSPKSAAMFEFKIRYTTTNTGEHDHDDIVEIVKGKDLLNLISTFSDQDRSASHICYDAFVPLDPDYREMVSSMEHEASIVLTNVAQAEAAL